MRRVSMARRDELLAAVSERYRASGRADKSRIVEEFASATGYHRKRAMRMLRAGPSSKRSAPRPSRRIYGAAEREALIVLWEASDRVCGKRLKAIIPMLIEAMVRHGHLALAPEVRSALMKMSAATIDRATRALQHAAPAIGLRIDNPPINSGSDPFGLARSAAWLR
jgi:hypothetical protein